MDGANQTIIWEPQPGPQTHYITCPVFEVGFGGARGGGKTDGSLGVWLSHADLYGEHAIGLMVRRTLVELTETIERSKQIFTPLGATYHAQEKMWRMPNGARLRFAYLENDSDADNYQGHSYCVGVGTPIRMASGSHKAIEQIAPGEMVATLEGPKRVKYSVKPYLAPCVRVLVRSERGEVLGEQIHPVWHPVLTTSGLISSRKSQKPHTFEQRQCEKLSPYIQHEESPSCGAPEIPAWFAYSGDDQTACRDTRHSPQVLRRPERSSVPVVLHLPSGPLRAEPVHVARSVSRLSRVLCRLRKRWWSSLRDSIIPSWDRLRLGALSLLAQGRSCLDRPSAPSCAQHGLPTAQDSLTYCQSCPCLCDGQPRGDGETAQVHTRSLADAESIRRESPLDASGTTQGRSHSEPLSWVHPYTGEVRSLSEQVTTGTMEFVGFEEAYVSDLCVEDANHYISITGLINKNTCVFIEEAGNFPNPAPIFKLMATLRSGAGVPCQMRLTFNPGGAGHQWVKARYIDPAPMGYEIINEEFTNPFTGERLSRERVFIPSRVTDNRFLGTDYIANLQMSGSPALVKAWLEGDWNIVAGAYFPEFGPQHVIEPFEIPKHWMRFGAYDHGTAAPYSFTWGAVADGEFFPEIPRGAIVVYREDYGWSGKPNEGLWLPADEIARRIMAKMPGETLNKVVADPSIFPAAKSRGPSIAEDLMTGGLLVAKADNARKAGWNQIRKRLVGIAGTPHIYFFKTCVHLIRTLPSLQHDPHDPSDCDTEGEDHAGDSLRYLCMARPWVEVAEKAEVINTAPPKLQDVLGSHFNRPKSNWR